MTLPINSALVVKYLTGVTPNNTLHKKGINI